MFEISCTYEVKGTTPDGTKLSRSGELTQMSMEQDEDSSMRDIMIDGYAEIVHAVSSDFWRFEVEERGYLDADINEINLSNLKAKRREK